MSQHEETSPPSIFRMMKSFTKELTEYIKNGAPNVSPDDYAVRLDICKKCPHLISKSMRCGKCGCLLQHKAKWRTSDCPINKWPEQDTSDISEDEKK